MIARTLSSIVTKRDGNGFGDADNSKSKVRKMVQNMEIGNAGTLHLIEVFFTLVIGPSIYLLCSGR